MKGEVTYKEEEYWDKCEENSRSVREYFCEGKELRSFVNRCPNNGFCSDGTCI